MIINNYKFGSVIKKQKSWFRTCKYCEEDFYSDSRGGTVCNNCNQNLARKKRKINDPKRISARNVLEMRNLFKIDMPMRDIAKKYNLHKTTIYNIKNRVTWNWL